MKKILYLLLVLVAGSAYGQGAWTQKADFGGGYRIRAASFVINGKGYMGTGYDPVNGGLMNDLWEYDPVTDQWTQKTNFPGAVRQAATGFATGGKGYIGAGTGLNNSNTCFYSDFWEYDPVTDQWTAIDSIPTAGRNEPAGFAVNGKGYVCCGNGVNVTPYYFNDLWEYDPVTGNWTQKTSLPASPRKSPVEFVIGNKAYVGTGDYQTALSDLWEYDPVTDNWTSKAAFGAGPIYTAVGFTIGTQGYAGTGSFNGSVKTDTFLTYNPVQDTWTPQASFGGGNRTIAWGFAIGNKGYIGTGYIGGTTWAKDFWEFDPGSTLDITAPSANAVLPLYPNPAQNTVSIPFTGTTPEAFTLTFYESNGAVVKTCSGITTGELKTDISSLANGLYMYHLYTGSGISVTGKFIIQR